MKTSIVKIGNSQGIRIPKAILNQINMHGAVVIKVKDNSLVVTPDDALSGRELAIMSEAALSKTWDTPEEDEAWKDLLSARL